MIHPNLPVNITSHSSVPQMNGHFNPALSLQTELLEPFFHFKESKAVLDTVPLKHHNLNRKTTLPVRKVDQKNLVV